MYPAPEQPPDFLIYYSIYIILSTFKYDYSFDQQELLIRLSQILGFSSNDARTKENQGRSITLPRI